MAFCLSYAALIFSGPLAPFLSTGMAVTFLSAAVGAAVIAWRSSFPFAIAGPDTSTSAVVASLVAAMAARLAGGTHLLGGVLIVIALATALTGLLLCLLGLLRAGRAIRYVPFPVMGGFLGASGALMMLGAVQVLTDHRLTIASLPAFWDAGLLAKIAAGAAIAIVLEILLARSRSPLILPMVLLAAILVTHMVLWLKGIAVTDAQAAGWMFKPPPPALLALPWRTTELRAFPWAELPELGGDIVAVMFVTAITVLLNATGIEIATKREADIERELKAVGLANLAGAALGGYVSCLTVNRTILNRSAGATGRLSGLTLAALSAAMLVVNPAFLGHMPKFALGGLLLFTGGRLFARWLINAARQLLPLEYLSLLAIALIIVNLGFVAGTAIGIVIGCLTFAVGASRVGAIKFSFDGADYHSALDRRPEELALLAEHGREIQGMALQSYLFFGSANQLYRSVKALLAGTPCRFLLFDFRLVTGLDSSATYSFSQIKDAADACGTRLVLVNLSPQVARAFGVAHFLTSAITIAPDLDRALESCEQAVIDAHRSGQAEAQSLLAWLGEALGDAGQAQVLASMCTRREFAAGELIARQDEAADCMHFILEGRVGVLVEDGDGDAVRVRSLGAGTTIGEMGLITGNPRSGTIQAESASVLYAFPLAAWQRIQRDDPALGQALLRYLTTVMAERLGFANRMISILQR
jgi:SulP family sulfate permease